jgi:hypothetical protein
MKTKSSSVAKTATTLLFVLSSFAGMAGVTTWAFSAWDLVGALQPTDQQVVEATFSL